MTVKAFRKLTTSRTARVAGFLFAFYWIAAFFLPFELLISILNAVSIAVAVVVSIAYAPAWVEALAEDRPDRVGQLSLGIGCTWIAFILTRIWAGAWRTAGQPDWMANSAVVGFFVWLMILGGILHITAPGSLDGRIPRRNIVLAIIAIAVGLSVGGGFVVWRLTSPDFLSIE